MLKIRPRIFLKVMMLILTEMNQHILHEMVPMIGMANAGRVCGRLCYTNNYYRGYKELN